MNNRLFNVNGKGTDMLKDALSLVFKQWGGNTTCEAWIESQEHGLILLWHKDKNSNGLPAKMTAESVTTMVQLWLSGDFAKTVKLSDWCGDSDHDGHNSMGWQVYCEDWGHVGSNPYAICAIKPAFMWHGK